MLNASVGVQRVIGRLRRPQEDRRPSARTLQIRSLAAARHVRRGIHSVVVASRLVPVRETPLVVERPAGDPRRPLLWRLGHDRAVAVAVAGILVGASLVSVSGGQTIAATGGTDRCRDRATDRCRRWSTTAVPTGAPSTTTGGTERTGDGPSSGLVGAVEFGSPDPTLNPSDDFAAVDFGDGGDRARPSRSTSRARSSTTARWSSRSPSTRPSRTAATSSASYTVAEGDTLVGIASKFGVSMMSVWWANDLKSKDVKAGRTLRIPPVTGLIVTVAATDTLDALAAKYERQQRRTSSRPTASTTRTWSSARSSSSRAPRARRSRSRRRSPRSPTTRRPDRRGGGGSGSSVRPPTTYTGGAFLWPVVGGGNYISQYFHYGHYAIDIAADYGSTVRAAAAGTVIFAGWKSNGGGYQVWIAHGSGLYTTYNHMSAISVGRGEHVGRGEQVGRVGQSGNATGPHLHFEVWRGPVWDGGRRVNPLGYF